MKLCDSIVPSNELDGTLGLFADAGQRLADKDKGRGMDSVIRHTTLSAPHIYRYQGAVFRAIDSEDIQSPAMPFFSGSELKWKLHKAELFFQYPYSVDEWLRG